MVVETDKGGKKRKVDRVDKGKPEVNKKVKKRRRKYKLRLSSGWGRMRRVAIAAFYTDLEKSPYRLLCLLTKFKQRYGVSHKKLIKYCHLKMKHNDPHKDAKSLILCYCDKGFQTFTQIATARFPDERLMQQDVSNVRSQMEMLNKVSSLGRDDLDVLIDLIKKFGIREQSESVCNEFQINENNEKKEFQLCFEHIPTHFLKKKKVWEMLLDDIPCVTLLRSLSRMTSLKVFDNEANIEKVLKKFKEIIDKKIKVHPIIILKALFGYNHGGNLGSFHDCVAIKESWDLRRYKWTPVKKILNGLEKLLKDVMLNLNEDKKMTTGKKMMIALDMARLYQNCTSCPKVSCADIAVMMTLISLYTDDISCIVTAYFKDINGVRLIDVTNEVGDLIKNEDFAFCEAVNKLKKYKGNCSQDIDHAMPMKYARENGLNDIDAFVIFSGSVEGSESKVTPSDALIDYRKEANRPKAKLVFCSLDTKDFTIVDQNDMNMLDVCGFEPNLPFMISNFIKYNSNE